MGGIFVFQNWNFWGGKGDLRKILDYMYMRNIADVVILVAKRNPQGCDTEALNKYFKSGI